MQNLGYAEDNVLTEKERVCTDIILYGTVSYYGGEGVRKNPDEEEFKSAETLSKKPLRMNGKHTDEDSDVEFFSHVPPQHHETGIPVT